MIYHYAISPSDHAHPDFLDIPLTDPKVISITGHAGSGKSTQLLKFLQMVFETGVHHLRPIIVVDGKRCIQREVSEIADLYTIPLETYTDHTIPEDMKKEARQWNPGSLIYIAPMNSVGDISCVEQCLHQLVHINKDMVHHPLWIIDDASYFMTSEMIQQLGFTSIVLEAGYPSPTQNIPYWRYTTRKY